MPLQFQYLFTRVGMWRRKEQGDALIDYGMVCCKKWGVDRRSRGKLATSERHTYVSKAAPRDSYDTDTTATTSSRDGGDIIRLL